MTLSTATHFPTVRAESWSPIVDDLIIRTVHERHGVKESELALCVMVSLAENRIESSPGSILRSIHRLINMGRLVGVDCEIDDNGYTFVLPSKTKVRIAIPIYIVDQRTRH